jgi:hypothetical protein
VPLHHAGVGMAQVASHHQQREPPAHSRAASAVRCLTLAALSNYVVKTLTLTAYGIGVQAR